MGRICWVCVLLAVALAMPFEARAQQQKKPSAEKAAPPAGQQTPPPAAAGVPDPFKLNLMIRSSIIALNQANKTGNYTVLQDLSAPAFRAANDSARLAQIFAHLRSRNLDLTPVLFFTPKLTQEPMINAGGIMRLTGYFPTQPERVNFDLYFQQLNGDWRIFGIGVSVSPNDQTAALPAQPDAPAQAAAAPPSKPQARPRAAAKKETPAPAAKQKPAATAETAVENRTTSNAVRIDLGSQWKTSSEQPDSAPAR